MTRRIDDGDARMVWRYQQATEGRYAVRVHIQSTSREDRSGGDV